MLFSLKKNDFIGDALLLKMVRPSVVRHVTVAKSVEVPPMKKS